MAASWNQHRSIEVTFSLFKLGYMPVSKNDLKIHLNTIDLCT